jgi:serine/threonine protein kinase/formylglycine-generating enzyme required for sulfatase activity
MGEVFLAVDSLLDRRVAIKVISAADPDPTARERFLVEARAIARLQHPNVVSIYRVGHVQGMPYLVSEFVDGQSLNNLPKPMAWQRVLSIGMDIARALAAAHQRGVLHRDIKPANVITTHEGEAKLLDFGIAKLLDAREWGAQAEAPQAGSSSLSVASADAPTGSIPCEAPGVRVGGETSRLTGVGFVVGTPAYMAPEVRRGAPATFRSDVYSLGVLLHELCTGALPVPDSPENLSQTHGVDPAFSAVVGRCLHPDPSVRYASGNEVRSALAQLTPEARVETIPEGNPYPGLRSFDTDRAGLYFGRDSETRDVLERLASEGFVVVTGDSGVGKSSLCRAGLLPRIQRWFGTERVWQHATVVPGTAPCRSLAISLGQTLGEDADLLERMVREDPGDLGRLVRSRLEETRGLVLFVDQLEELVTLGETAEAAACATALYWLSATRDCVRVLASARSDFLGRLTSLPGLGDRLGPALYFLRPLTRERLREAVEAPARAKGVRFGAEWMVDELVQSAAEAGGGLPLLQFALSELWAAKPDEHLVISEQTYRDMGGARGALARHADRVLASMSQELRQTAKRLLRELVTGHQTRARRTGAELGTASPTAQTALDALVAGRLVVACESPEGTTYELAHDALLRSWATLAHLVASDAEARVVRERLRLATAEWKRLGRARGPLWNRRQLREADLVDPGDLGEDEVRFVRASRTQQRLLTGGAIGAMLALVAAVAVAHGATVLAQNKKHDAAVAQELLRAHGNLQEAQAASRGAEDAERRAFDAFDRGDQDTEQAWSAAREKRSQVDLLLDEAERSAESAVLLDGSRYDTRQALAAVLVARASQARARHDDQGEERALARARLYDDENPQVTSARRPCPVTIASIPPGATLRMEQFDGSAYVAVPSARELVPGSYRATLELANHATTRIPFVVRTGEAVELSVPMLPAASVPEGFEYVPPGVGWYGSGAAEDLRKDFFHANPIHPVHVPAFLIARHETTYGQWLDYVRSLPRDARTGALPTVKDGGFRGFIEVRELSGGTFELTLGLGNRQVRAREKEPLFLEGRRKEGVDWTSMPVSGISAKDAVEYTSWLDQTGRVSGARLCSEIEWERAARGADLRPYPHGRSLQPAEANIDATYGKTAESMAPDGVGTHAASRSPFFVDDMAGNVWEWTSHATHPGQFVARGGSFNYTAQVARVENREVPEVGFRDVSVGLRVCASSQDGTLNLHAVSDPSTSAP